MPIWSQDFVSWKTPLLATGVPAKRNNVWYYCHRDYARALEALEQPGSLSGSMLRWWGGDDSQTLSLLRLQPVLRVPNICGGWYYPIQQSITLHLSWRNSMDLSLQPHNCQLLVQWFLLIYLHCSYYKLLWVCNAISSPSTTLQNFTDGEQSSSELPLRGGQSRPSAPYHLQQLVYWAREKEAQPAAPSGAATCAGRQGFFPWQHQQQPHRHKQGTPMGEGLVPAASTALTAGEASHSYMGNFYIPTWGFELLKATWIT